jgi:hypothetical protein
MRLASAACWCVLAPAAAQSNHGFRALDDVELDRRAAAARLRPGPGNLAAALAAERARRDRATPGSVALWALGRCATGTFADSLKAAGNFSYCRGRKEGFGLGGLSAGALRACVGKARRRSKAALTHIKPQHLGGPLAPVASPDALAEALAATGFATVVVIERQNHLARLVSSFENRVREWRAATNDEFAGRARPRVARRAAAFFSDPLRTIEWEAATLAAGAQACRARGLAVLELDFDADVVAEPCGAVARAFAAAAPDAPLPPCVARHSHRAASRRNAGLAGRVGPAAAASIEAALERTPYAWMLDLDAQAWPSGAPRPTPVAHPAGPRTRAAARDGFARGGVVM